MGTSRALRALRGQFQPSTRGRARPHSDPAPRANVPLLWHAAETTYCGPCGANHVRHAATVQAAIVAIWGTAGLTRYQAEARLQRLFARQAR